MKRTIIKILILFTFIGCTGVDTDKPVEESQPAMISDTDIRAGIIQADSVETIDMYISDFRRRNPDYGDTARLYGGGDCEGYFIVRTDTAQLDKLVLDDYLCGDYGNGINQYYIRNGRLSAVRNKKIEYSGVENNKWTYQMVEQIYYFGGDSVFIKSREKATNDLYDTTLSSVSFRYTQLAADSLIDVKSKELSRILTQKLEE